MVVDVVAMLEARVPFAELDVGCRLNNYCADLARSVVLNPATQRQKK